MLRVAVYARYSTDQQRATSIDDQIQRCQAVAQRHGLGVDPGLIFSDAALSGTNKHIDKREGYKALLEALDAGKIDVLIVDEFSRLTRDAVDQALITRRFDENQRIRLLTADGLDTAQPNWQLSVGLIGLVSQQSIRDTKHRVTRGMLGQLERGYMIATPAFGYGLKREFDGRGERIGTYWTVVEKDAAIIQEIYQRRDQGQSMHQIARWLNDSGIPICRASRRPDGGYWRAARIKNILSNPIYRGEFVWNNSTTVKSRAKKTGRKLEVRKFPRPELRLVSDETWQRCNANTISRTGYGGGKHALAGLLRCQYCSSMLVLTSKPRCYSMYCANCTAAKSMNGDQNAQTSTIAVDAVKLLLSTAMKEFLSPAFVASFRKRLQQKLNGDFQDEIKTLEQELAIWTGAQKRLSHKLAMEDDPVLDARYQEAKTKHRGIQEKLDLLRDGANRLDTKAIQVQMQADPSELIARLFDADLPPERLRSMLAQLFPDIVFEGKTSRYTAYFRVTFCLGTAMGVTTGTGKMDEMPLEQRYEVHYSPSSRNASLAHWSVAPLNSAPDDDMPDGMLETICVSNRTNVPESSL